MDKNNCHASEKITGVKAPTDLWIDRPYSMMCRTCIWFIQKVGIDVDKAIVGRCRRRCPTMNGFPVVFLTDWCGDHRIDENKLQEKEKPHVLNRLQ